MVTVKGKNEEGWVWLRKFVTQPIPGLLPFFTSFLSLRFTYSGKRLEQTKIPLKEWTKFRNELKFRNWLKFRKITKQHWIQSDHRNYWLLKFRLHRHKIKVIAVRLKKKTTKGRKESRGIHSWYLYERALVVLSLTHTHSSITSIWKRETWGPVTIANSKRNDGKVCDPY